MNYLGDLCRREVTDDGLRCGVFGEDTIPLTRAGKAELDKDEATEDSFELVVRLGSVSHVVAGRVDHFVPLADE